MTRYSPSEHHDLFGAGSGPRMACRPHEIQQFVGKMVAVLINDGEVVQAIVGKEIVKLVVDKPKKGRKAE